MYVFNSNKQGNKYKYSGHLINTIVFFKFMFSALCLQYTYYTMTVHS